MIKRWALSFKKLIFFYFIQNKITYNNCIPKSVYCSLTPSVCMEISRGLNSHPGILKYGRADPLISERSTSKTFFGLVWRHFSWSRTVDKSVFSVRNTFMIKQYRGIFDGKVTVIGSFLEVP